MQRVYQKSTIWICLISLSAAWNSPAFGRNSSTGFFDQKSKTQITRGVLNKKLVLMPQINKINFGFGRYWGIEYIYEKTISKIFFQNKKLVVEIIDASKKRRSPSYCSIPSWEPEPLIFHLAQILSNKPPIKTYKKSYLKPWVMNTINMSS